MKLIRYWYIVVTLVLMITASCSTEKNTLINRSYHGMTAHYNGYFNANELIRQSLNSFRGSLKEDYYAVLPIDPLPDEKQVVGMYPAIDTAISKCAKVIQRHSMPSNDRPSLKKEEHNSWIDENWTTIGIANYYRRDYEAAMKGFLFVKKFYSNDPSIFIADLWIAKTNIQLNKITEAGFSLSSLDKAIANEADREKDKQSTKKGDEKEDPIAKVPKSILFDFEKTKAELALQKQNPKEAIKFLEESLRHAKLQTDKSRVHYIIAQLNEFYGSKEEAKLHYTECLKYNAPYEMHFNSRLKRAFMGADEKVRKELMKMLRDAKNTPYKDQIYFALAEIELQKVNEPKAFEYLTLSAFYSTANSRQKGISYEKMGDLSFAKRNYVNAQKYYDSCATVIDDKYPNAEGVRNKANKLADLVAAVETINFEDSVQRIAGMSDGQRVAFIEDVIKKTKEDQERKKKMQAERLRELQQNQNISVQTSGSGSKWYFNNPKTRSDGYEEFRRLWGNRENEDNWRRIDKTVMFTMNEDSNTDTTVLEAEILKDKKDTLTLDLLLMDIPLTDSSLKASNKRLLEALYAAGVIYKEELNEPEMAKKQFEAVRSKNSEGDVDLSSAFQLYKLYANDEIRLGEQKQYILTTYPNSDYAYYLRDPDFFIKRKEREALAEQDYLIVLERYRKGLYMPVVSRADVVIAQEKENKFRSKYMLLKAMSMGQMTEDKRELIPVLEQLIAEYPATEEEAKAKEMLKVIQTGYSKNISSEFEKKSPFNYDEKSPQWVIVFLKNGESSSLAKSKVSDFNREFFGRDGLKVTSKIFQEDQSIILVQEFDNDVTALKYVRIFKSTRKHLLDLQKAKVMVITQENLKLLYENKMLQEYEIFYDEFY